MASRHPATCNSAEWRAYIKARAKPVLSDINFYVDIWNNYGNN